MSVRASARDDTPLWGAPLAASPNRLACGRDPAPFRLLSPKRSFRFTEMLLIIATIHYTATYSCICGKIGFVFADRFRRKTGACKIWLTSQAKSARFEILTTRNCGNPIVPSKAARPKNALAHGLYASDLVLAWENEQDFVDLHESIRQELNPVGSLEDIAVLDIARLHWVKRRLNVGAQLAYHRHPDAPAITEAGKEGWQGVRNYLRDTNGGVDTMAMHIRAFSKAHLAALKNVMELIDKRTAQMSSAPGEYKPKLRKIPAIRWV